MSLLPSATLIAHTSPAARVRLLQEREAKLSSRCARLEKEVERERAAGAARLEKAAQEKASALQRQLTEMTGTAEVCALHLLPTYATSHQPLRFLPSPPLLRHRR